MVESAFRRATTEPNNPNRAPLRRLDLREDAVLERCVGASGPQPAARPLPARPQRARPAGCRPRPGRPPSPRQRARPGRCRARRRGSRELRDLRTRHTRRDGGAELQQTRQRVQQTVLCALCARHAHSRASAWAWCGGAGHTGSEQATRSLHSLWLCARPRSPRPWLAAWRGPRPGPARCLLDA